MSLGEDGGMLGCHKGSGSPPKGLCVPFLGEDPISPRALCPPRSSWMGDRDQDIIYCLNRGMVCRGGGGCDAAGTPGTLCGLGDCREVLARSPKALEVTGT